MNKFSLVLGVFLTILFLSAGAFAASVELPGATIMQGESWEISLNCPNMGTPGDICLVEWTGPVDGNFIEQDSGSDPDPVNKHQTLDIAGNYTYTIRECPTGIGSCGVVDDTETVTVLPSSGEIWTTYRSRVTGPWAPSLKVSGIAPAGTTKIRLYVRGENNGATVVPMVLADFNNETNYYSKNFNLKTVYETNPQILNVQAAFIDEVNGTTIDSARVVVEALLLDVVQSKVDQLELDVDDLNTLALDLNSQTTVLEQQVADLNSQDANFQVQIDVINAQLADHDQNILDLQNDMLTLDTRVTDLNIELTQMINDVNSELTQTIQDLNAELTTMVNDLNAEMQIAIANLQSQIDALDVRVTDLEDRMNIVEYKIDQLDDGTITFNYYSDTDRLYVRGEAPLQAKCVKAYFVTSSGTYIHSAFTQSVIQDVNEHDYNIVVTTTGWPKEILNVFVSFRSDFSCSTQMQLGVDTFEGLLGDETFGFRDITTSTYVSSYYVNNVSVPIAFALKPDHADNYKIQYHNNTTGRWETLVGCSWYDEGVKTYKRRNIDLTTTGVHKIKLRSKNCYAGVGETYKSYPFKIRHVDLKDSLTASTTITTPVSNSDMTLAYPYGSIADSVYWTQSGSVPLVAYVNTTSAPSSKYVKVRFKDASLNPSQQELEIVSNGLNWDIDGVAQGFNTAWNLWSNTNYTNNAYTTIELESYIVSQQASYADVNVGIDNEDPVISSINPDEAGIMNGVYRWFSDINDDLSGLAEVNFYLIEKNGVVYCDGNCWTGDGNVVWSQMNVDFNSDLSKWFYDLNTLNHPDGDYNVAFEAYDIAGNYTYLEVDPIIDNTSPVIASVTITSDPTRRDNSVLVEAIVTDNITGVASVTATLDGNVIVLTVDGNKYTGAYYSDNTWTIGTHVVTIDSVDVAGNTATQNKNFEVLKNYYFNIDTSASGTATTNFSFDGNFRNDLNVVPTLDGNVILVTSNIVDDANVVFDANGLYTITTNSLSAGTYVIDLNYNQVDYNYVERINIQVNSPPAPNPGPSPGPSGGPSGSPSGTPSGNERDTNEPVEPEVPVEPEMPVEGNEDETGNETGTDTNTITPPVEPMDTPTGLFGLGDIGSFIPGILALIAIIIVIVGIVIVKKKK
ncbi:MAG: hypothetical protein HOE11_04970 [Candidatus Diapherotrites archaeon]|nr:hypothetical protein [Candidatus Diapherotrites archaeon]